MKKPFARQSADLVARKLGFNRQEVSTLLKSIRDVLAAHGPVWDHWLPLIDKWLEDLSECASFDDDKAVAETISQCFGNQGLDDVVFMLDDFHPDNAATDSFLVMAKRLSYLTNRVVSPWLFDESVEEI